MKRLIMNFIILLMFAACSTLREIPPYRILNTIDFRKYSEAGFLITPEKYTGEYKSIGIIDFIRMPGAKYISERDLADKEEYVSRDPIYHSTSSQWFIEKIDMNETIEDLYKQCLTLGADALINFSIEINEVNYSTVANPIRITGYRIKGLAIKRL